MFEGLNHSVQRSLDLAQEEATIVGAGYVGTEAVLLGLSRTSGSRAQAALNACGITYSMLAAEFRRLFPASAVSGAPGKVLSPTPRTVEVMERAIAGCKEDRQPVDTASLVAALWMSNGLATQLLNEVLSRLGSSGDDLAKALKGTSDSGHPDYINEQ